MHGLESIVLQEHLPNLWWIDVLAFIISNSYVEASCSEMVYQWIAGVREQKKPVSFMPCL